MIELVLEVRLARLAWRDLPFSLSWRIEFL